MIKVILFCSILGWMSENAGTHQYLVKEIPENTEGIMYTGCIHEPNDTITVVKKKFVVIKCLD